MNNAKTIANKKENILIFICWLAYTAAYVGRVNFSASNVAIYTDLNVEKDLAGLVGSFFFFAYGAGQLINGILSKKYNARIMIFLSLMLSSVFNILMPISNDISIMKFIWLGNGIVQSVLWSTLIKTLSDRLSDQKLPKAILVMSTTVAIGTFAAYGISALCVEFSNWKTVFFISGFILVICAFIWLFLFKNVPDKINLPIIKNENKEKKIKMGKAIIFALIITAFAGTANGFIKDGINTWVPSVLKEEFHFSESFSILLTLLLPLISTLGAAIAKKFHEKIKSHSAMNFIFYSFSSLLCGGIILSLRSLNIILAMLCFICVACGMSMINNVITSMFALDRRKVLNAGFAAGLLNTFCYIGSTITSYGLGSIADSYGWNMVFVIMLFVCISASILCIAGMLVERKIKE